MQNIGMKLDCHLTFKWKQITASPDALQAQGATQMPKYSTQQPLQL